MWLCRILLIAALISPLTVAGQDVPPQGKDAKQVVVDVVVRDNTDQPVTGLHREDFQLFENGKKQRIRFFQDHAVPVPNAQASQTPTLAPNSFTNANSLEPDSINIILVDQLNTSIEHQEVARQAIINYVVQKPPGAAFALFTLRNDDPACTPYDYAQQLFGLSSLNASLQPYGYPQQLFGVNTSVVGSNWSCSSRGELLLVQGVTQDKERLLKALDSKLALPHATWLRDALPASLYIQGWNRLDTYPAGVPEVFDTSLSSLADIGQFLRGLPGRKSLLWMSDSFDAAPIAQVVDVWFAGKFKGWEKTDPLAPIQMHHLTASRLAEDRIALYPVDLSGRYKDVQVKRRCPIVYEDVGAALLASFNAAPTRVTSESEEWSCSAHYMALSYLASQSGGRAFRGVTATENAIAQAVSDNSTYYTLVYSPTNTRNDGKLRRVRVTLAQRNYRPAYRRAYYADDRSTLFPPMPGASQDVYLPRWVYGDLPWQVVRLTGLNSSHTDVDDEALLSALRYAAPESNAIVFTAHIEPNGAFAKATPEQMLELQDSASFIPERTEKVFASLDAQKQLQHKRRVVVDRLPPADSVYLQPYLIDYSLPLNQLTVGASENGDRTFRLNVALIAYDALGRKVTSVRQTVDGISVSEKQRFEASDFHFRQTVPIPDRVTLIRLAVCGVPGNRVGSLEVPLWAISSPYLRKALPLPPVGDNPPGKSR
jgi:VWFA-related protein